MVHFFHLLGPQVYKELLQSSSEEALEFPSFLSLPCEIILFLHKVLVAYFSTTGTIMVFTTVISYRLYNFLEV